jgi:hypothetical protein
LLRAVQQSSLQGDNYGKKIFVTHKSSYELTAESPAVEILFRIEKVSSKIGLFKLYIEPDYGDGVQGAIGGVFTDNIEVKSKVNDKAKAQYIDSIQNILVPAPPHAAGGQVPSVSAPMSGAPMAGRLMEPSHAVRSVQHHHAGSLAPPVVQSMHQQLSDSSMSYSSVAGAGSSASRVSGGHHGRNEGGSAAGASRLLQLATG